MADYRARRLAFYEACVHGWVQTTFEKDKSILAVASGSLAIVFGVVLQFAASIPLVSLVLFGLSGLFFGVSVLICIAIFAKNKPIFEANIQGETEASLRPYDTALNVVFATAVIALMAGGGWMATTIILQRIHHVSEAPRTESVCRRQCERTTPPRAAATVPSAGRIQDLAAAGPANYPEKGLEPDMAGERNSSTRKAVVVEVAKSATGLQRLAPTPPQGASSPASPATGAAQGSQPASSSTTAQKPK